MNSNQIKSLNLSVMNLPKLRVLDVANNKIEWLDRNEFLNLLLLDVLRIGGNPLKTFELVNLESFCEGSATSDHEQRERRTHGVF